jgi:flagellar hook assembly protein FlgD
MKNNLRGASAAVVIAVAAWGLSAAPASAVGEPTTTPTITSPVDGANVSGDVSITATSTEAQVQFYEDGVAFGTPVATSGGIATTTWPTWGLANGVPTAWTAADCNDIGCNPTQSTAVSVTVLNDAPAVTSPLDGSISGPSPTITATSPGGALQFTLDGTPIGVVLTSPYTEAVAGPLADGMHTVVVRECDVTGTFCSGGPTAQSTFTVVTLHPAITSVAPNPFSPKVDGRNDTTSFRVHLLDAETVTWSVKNALDQIVNGPHNAGLLGAGDHVFKWSGHNNALQTVGDGVYTIAVATSAPDGDVTVHGSTSAHVRVDDTASVVHIVNGNGATFYPVIDGYLDLFGPKVSDNEGGTLWLQIFTTTNTLVAQITKPHPTSGTFQMSWNGRNRSNNLVAAGTYRFRFLSQDVAGNRSATGFGTVYVSLRRLVLKTVTLTKPGNGRVVVGTTETACTGYSTQSNFTNGLAIGNWCDENVVGGQLVVAEYVFALPGAIHYNSIRLQSRGMTSSAPQLVGGLIFNFPAQDFDVVGTSTLGSNYVAQTSIYGSSGPAGRVNASRQIKVGVAVPDGPGATVRDYDIGTVSVVVSYSVLG